MSNENGYNGYTNWETWEVHNHLDSDMLAEWARAALETSLESESDAENAREVAVGAMAWHQMIVIWIFIQIASLIMMMLVAKFI